MLVLESFVLSQTHTLENYYGDVNSDIAYKRSLRVKHLNMADQFERQSLPVIMSFCLSYAKSQAKDKKRLKPLLNSIGSQQQGMSEEEDQAS